MLSRLKNATILAGMFATSGLAVTITDVSLTTAAVLGVSIHGSSAQHPLRASDEFFRTVDDPTTLQKYILGGTAEVDVETGVFRGQANVSSPAGGRPSVRWDTVMQVQQPMVGAPGRSEFPLSLYVDFGFTPDVGAVGSSVSAEYHVTLHTSQGGSGAANASYRYFYSETVGATGSVPEVTTDVTGDVLINSIFDVVLRTNLEYECCDHPILIVTTVTGGVSSRLGGGFLNSSNTAYLTLNLPPGYALEPGSPFLSKPFEPVPEPWMAPLLGSVFTALTIWRRRGRLGLGRS